MNRQTRTLKGIIFDLDGVVAETEDLHRRAYNLAFEEAGLATRWSELDYKDRLSLSGGSKLTTVPIPEEIADPAAYRADLYGKKRNYYLHLLETENLPARPGVVRLIDLALSEGIRLGAASTCAKEGALAILDRAIGKTQRTRFRALRAGDDVAHRKPAPDIYLAALRDLELEPTDCVAIEDTQHGLEASAGAGLCTLVTPSQYTVGDAFPGAEDVVEDLAAGDVDLQYLENLLVKFRGRS